MKSFTFCVITLLTLSALFLSSCARKSDDYLRSGMLHQKERKYKEAFADFDKAIELDSTNAKAYLERAKIACKVGITEPRERDLSRYIELTEHDLAVAYIGRAISKRLRQDFQSSFEDLNKAIHIYPADIQSFTFKEQFLEDLGDSAQLKVFRGGLDEQTRTRMKTSREESCFLVKPTAPKSQNNDAGEKAQ
jgi:tetratricopeptide (TPR) repeat protein